MLCGGGNRNASSRIKESKLVVVGLLRHVREVRGRTAAGIDIRGGGGGKQSRLLETVVWKGTATTTRRREIMSEIINKQIMQKRHTKVATSE